MDDPFDRTDTIHPGDVRRLAATLDVPTPEGVPPLWHWISFLDRSPTSSLGEDGHPRRGGLVEQPPHPRRMFAGGRVRWARPIPSGVPVRRTAAVGELVHKEGSRGPLAFVTISLTYSLDDQVLAVEEQDLVYLPASDPITPTATMRPAEEAARPPDLLERAAFSETALFRFSALTFNSHRIHYDLRYALDVEGYPGLVVHGPMLIIRMLDVVRSVHGENAIAELSFRALAPAFCGSIVDLFGWRDGPRIDLVASHEGRALMKAAVTLRDGGGRIGG